MERTLKDVCKFYAGTGFPVKYQGKEMDEFPFFKVGDIANNVKAGYNYLELCNNYISELEVKEIKGKILPPNTVVFAKIGEALKLNRRAITSVKCLIDNNAMGIAPNENELNLSYFFYYMKNLRMELLSESTTVPSVRKSKLEDTKISVPSLKKQLEIGNIFDKVNELIQLRTQQLIYLDILIKSRFVEMFGDSFSNPKNLPELIWKDVFSTTTGKLDSNAMVEDGEYPFFTCAKESFWIDEYAFDYEALLLAGNNAAGVYDVKYYNGKFNAYQRTYVLQLLNSDWSYILFKRQLEDKLLYLKSQSKGTNTRYLTMGILNDLKFIIPSIDEQKQYAEFTQKINKLKAEVQKSLDEIQILFNSLMQKYFE